MLTLTFVDDCKVTDLALSIQEISIPFTTIDLDQVKSKHAIPVTHIVLELAFIAQPVGVVEHPLPCPAAVSLLPVIFQLIFATSD
jgi:hypothetical protein